MKIKHLINVTVTLVFSTIALVAIAEACYDHSINDPNYPAINAHFPACETISYSPQPVINAYGETETGKEFTHTTPGTVTKTTTKWPICIVCGGDACEFRFGSTTTTTNFSYNFPQYRDCTRE